MSVIEKMAENTDYLTALKELTSKIKESLSGETKEFRLRMGDNIKHYLVFAPGKEPFHRLVWVVEKN